MTRRLPVVLAVIGALIIVATVVVTSIVRSDDTATLALPQRPESAVVVTEPGVLDAVDSTVTIRAFAENDEPVLLAVGRTAEVDAWLDGAEHVRVVGLSSWEELSVEVTAASPEATDPAADEETESPADEATEDATEDPADAAVPDPAGSDLWVAEADGTGEAELTWTDQPGQWSLVAATDGTAPAPTIELEWGREVSTPWLIPGIAVGALLFVTGAAMFVLDLLARREQRRRDETREQETAPAMAVSVEDTDPGTGQRLSRRQIREMERAVAQSERDRRSTDEAPPIPLADAEAEPDGATPDSEVPAPDDAADQEVDIAQSDDAAPPEPASDGLAGDTIPAETAADEVADAEAVDAAGPTTEDDQDDQAATEPATAEPAGLRGWLARRRSKGASDPAATSAGAATGVAESPAAESPTAESPADESSAGADAHAGSSPDEPADTAGATSTSHDDGGPDDGEDEEPAAPSWRSVWGFSGDQPPADTSPEDDEGKEAR